MVKFCEFEVVLPVLVVEFELRTFLFQKSALGGIKLCYGLETMGAVVIWAFMDGHLLPDFPAEESQTAIRTEEFRFPAASESLLDLE